MDDGPHRFCDVALPVPVDQLFTYSLPQSLAEQTLPGCRVLAPFGPRKLTGVVLHVHDRPPEQSVKPILKLIDAAPVLDDELLKLARWIAEYYCAPVGEVLKVMLPLTGETHRSKVYSLTPLGHDIVRQLTMEAPDDTSALLRLLEERARALTYLVSKVPNARQILPALLKKGWIAGEDQSAERDPLRASAERLEAEFIQRPDPGIKLKKAERECLAFLELHPGKHNLSKLSETVKGASEAARALARRGLIRLEVTQAKPVFGYGNSPPTLNQEQQTAFESIKEALQADEYRTFLLQGVTGSGKTEVYLRSIESALSRGKNALLLVPEIALTPAVAGQFFQRFGDQVAILHSAFGDAERADQWRRVRNGQARVVVGTRSGVFAPVQNLGLIIVDEEHDGSYKQGETPRYHGRDVALVRAKNASAVAVLGSATPSVESRFNADEKRYSLLYLPRRIADRPMPEVELVDMRAEFLETKQQATFSRRLLEEMTRRLKQREQIMLLINRRGFSSFAVCRSCGERVQCQNCSVVLTHHRRDQRMLCHYCAHAERIPVECPKCGSEHIQFIGAGSERVEDELHRHLPEARIARLDRDSASGKGAFEHILQTFREGHADILVGTQMIAKGHDIPNVTLVGVVLADIGLSMPDFRAAERTFQLLTQAAGRAGRGSLPGEVVVQTYSPDHYAVAFAAQQDYEGFYKKEIEFRKWLRYPPFSAFANILVRDKRQEEALRMASELGFLLTPQPPQTRVMGPAEAPVPRLRDEFRYQILIKAAKRSVLRDVVKRLREHALAQKWRSTALVIDVDPITLM
jgi:primosomal protein N' (replication factor Y) (superfamily II helicase)